MTLEEWTEKLEKAIANVIRAAVAEEREAIVALLETKMAVEGWGEEPTVMGNEVVAAIRARGVEPPRS